MGDAALDQLIFKKTEGNKRGIPEARINSGIPMRPWPSEMNWKEVLGSEKRKYCTYAHSYFQLQAIFIENVEEMCSLVKMAVEVTSLGLLDHQGKDREPTEVVGRLQDLHSAPAAFPGATTIYTKLIKPIYIYIYISDL